MTKPPVRYLDLWTIRFPFTAIISFLHRVSGVFVFLLIPFLLWTLDLALSSSKSFLDIKLCLTHVTAKLIMWLILVALGYHLIAGFRHLIMDVGIGESLKEARISGAIVLIISFIWALFIGIWLW